MNPMTELDKLKGIQADIAGLDLTEKLARDMALTLISNMERSLDRIKSAEWEEEDRHMAEEWAKLEAEAAKREATPIMSNVFDDYLRATFQGKGR